MLSISLQLGFARPYSSVGAYGGDPLLSDPLLGMDNSRSYLGGHHSAMAGVGATTAAGLHAGGLGVAGVDGITAGLRDTAINSLDLGGVGAAAGLHGTAGAVGVMDYDRNHRYLASRRFVVGKQPQQMGRQKIKE